MRQNMSPGGTFWACGSATLDALTLLCDSRSLIYDMEKLGFCLTHLSWPRSPRRGPSFAKVRETLCHGFTFHPPSCKWPCLSPTLNLSCDNVVNECWPVMERNWSIFNLVVILTTWVYTFVFYKTLLLNCPRGGFIFKSIWSNTDMLWATRSFFFISQTSWMQVFYL